MPDPKYKKGDVVRINYLDMIKTGTIIASPIFLSDRTYDYTIHLQEHTYVSKMDGHLVYEKDILYRIIPPAEIWKGLIHAEV